MIIGAVDRPLTSHNSASICQASHWVPLVGNWSSSSLTWNWCKFLWPKGWWWTVGKEIQRQAAATDLSTPQIEWSTPPHPFPRSMAQANDADLVLGHCHFQNRISFKELLAHSSVFGPFNPPAANQTNELRKYSRIKTRRVTPPPPISLIDRCTLFWTPYHSVVFLQRRCAATATQHLCGIEFVAAAACLRLFPCCVVLLLLLCVCFFFPPPVFCWGHSTFSVWKR